MEKMIDLNKNYQKDNLDFKLKKAYSKALEDLEFKKLVTSIKVKDSIAYKYTSKLERTVCELNNCKNCKSYFECKNKSKGMVYYPTLDNNTLDFNYVECKYLKKINDEKLKMKSKFFEIPYEIKIARMNMIDVTKERANIIKWITKFYKEYQKDHKQKGLFLDGSFGSGKTFMISALLNELSDIGYSTLIVYYPELLRSLKEGFGNEEYEDKIYELKHVDLLLLDDIGAESASSWNRDEVLGTILQYRMDNKMPTFFTSNLNIKELEEHFIIKDYNEERVKARRIIERVKYLTEELTLIAENRRK